MITSPDFYLRYSQFTFPGLYAKDIEKNLDNDVRSIGQVVRNSLIHRTTLKNGNTGSNTDMRYGDMTKVPWHRQCEDDIFVTASSMLAELFRRDPRGLTLERSVSNKLVLTCRFTSILMASILKTKGIPARVRSGFASYFQIGDVPNNKSDDHWINQYFDKKQSRWVNIDVDGSLESSLGFDPYDMPSTAFDFPADAWLKVRKNKKVGEHFYNAAGYSGLVAIAWELFYDFHCLMNSEIVYYHHPEMAMLNNFEKVSEKNLIEIDSLAKLMLAPDENIKILRKVWDNKKAFRLLRGGLLS